MKQNVRRWPSCLCLLYNIVVGTSTGSLHTGISVSKLRGRAEPVQPLQASSSSLASPASVALPLVVNVSKGGLEVYLGDLEDETEQDTTKVSDANADATFPFPKILHSTGKDLSQFPLMENWTSMNPGWEVDFLTNPRQQDLMKERCPECYQAYQAGNMTPVERSDLVRLLALDKDGGVYIDNDVVEMLPIEEWLPHFNYPSNVQMVLGTEFPTARNGNPFQFESWTLMSMPNNPVLKIAIKKIVENLRNMPDTEVNIVKRTGPAAFTAGVLEAMKEGDAELPSLAELNSGSGHLAVLKEKDDSKLRIVMLPYRAMGFHPAHGDDVVKFPMSDHLVEHEFMGVWRAKLLQTNYSDVQVHRRLRLQLVETKRKQLSRHRRVFKKKYVVPLRHTSKSRTVAA